MQTKQTVMELLDRLPEDCTLEDVLYHLYVIRSVQAGIEDHRHGETLSHDDVRAALRRRWQTGNAF